MNECVQLTTSDETAISNNPKVLHFFSTYQLCLYHSRHCQSIRFFDRWSKNPIRQLNERGFWLRLGCIDTYIHLSAARNVMLYVWYIDWIYSEIGMGSLWLVTKGIINEWWQAYTRRPGRIDKGRES